ncbi:hypothetical protein [Yaniella sp.]|uniref:hypothetical protein n=1 Tax=Yaniella sp. TaxID=2773929 RepID=UPI003F99CF12
MNQILVATATLGASLGGYLLAGFNERRRDKRTFMHERQQRASERAAQREDNRRMLQRETLLALQDALQAMARLTGKAMHFDHMQAREGKYTHLPGTLSEDMLTSTVEVRRLASRILDTKVRDTVDKFIELSTRLTTVPERFRGLSENDLENRAFTRLDEFGEGVIETMTVLGKAIRREIAWQPNDSSSGDTTSNDRQS